MENAIEGGNEPVEINRETELLKKIEELEAVLQEGRNLNNRLATCVKIFAEVHISKREKIKIANEINNAISERDVENIYNFYRKKYHLDDINPETEEYLYSDGFIANMTKYYKTYKGYNPLEDIEALVPPIEQYIFMQGQIQLDTLEEHRREYLMKTIESIQEEVATSISEIKRIAIENK